MLYPFSGPQLGIPPKYPGKRRDEGGSEGAEEWEMMIGRMDVE